MKIHVYNRQRALSFKKSALRLCIRSVLQYLELAPEELAFYFVSSKKISELHGQFFNDPSPTDCITFPIDSSYLGDVFVCPEVAIEYAKKHEIDPLEETLLYVIHGILHLAGFDDLTPKDKRIMRKKEKSCMGHLKKQGIRLTP